MEKIIDKNTSITDENEKIIANILHDIKSPLYSIKIGLAPHLDTELHRDIYEITLDTINYIENFLLNYNFKTGNFENNISKFDIKEIICEKLKNYKYMFVNNNIYVDLISDDKEYCICSIYPFVSSIVGNLISNIALHGAKNKSATIELYKKNNEIFIDFRNKYKNENKNFSLGLDFCKHLANQAKIELMFEKTTTEVRVTLKIPNLSCRNQH